MKNALKLKTIQNIKNIVLIIIMLIIIVVTISIWRTSSESGEISSNRVELIINADRFISASDYLTDEIRAYVATEDTEHKDNYFNEVENLKNREISISNMEIIGITEDEKNIIAQMQTLSNNLVPLEVDAMEEVETGNEHKALELVFGEEYFKTTQEIKSLEDQFQEMLGERTGEEVADIQEQLGIMYIVLISLLVIFTIIQLASEQLVRKVMINPVIKCTEVIMGISQGELSREFEEVSNTSEVGMLSHSTKTILSSMTTIINDLNQSFTQMANGNFDIDIDRLEEYYKGDFKTLADAKKKIVLNLSKTLYQINNISKQVSEGSTQIAVGATSLAEGATEQSITIQDLADTIRDISKEITATAKDSVDVKQSTEQAVKSLEVGSVQMKNMVNAMNSISSKSNEIRKIIKTIDDIAFQTNILSLNAAVEAARAGEAGKGFLVVADEVRNLATKSAQSAKDTAVLIEETIGAVNAGSEIAKNTADIMSVIETKTMQVNNYMDSIERSSKEQADAIKDINASVEQMTMVANQSSATLEESAAASEELSGQAQTLESLVNQFTIKKQKVFDKRKNV